MSTNPAIHHIDAQPPYSPLMSTAMIGTVICRMSTETDGVGAASSRDVRTWTGHTFKNLRCEPRGIDEDATAQ